MSTQFDPNSDYPEISVLLVDGQELVRSGLRHILQRADGFNIVGEASDGGEVLATAANCRPDIVLMDIRMRHISGIEATRQLTATNGPPVLALSTSDDDELLTGVLHAGAAGFILKHSSAEELIRAVRTVARGGAYLDPAMTDRVLRTYRRAPAPAVAHAPPEQLTARERDVLTLLARGLTNAEIADTLSISSTTVKSHIGRIFVKLDLRDRQAAIVYAYDHGIVTTAYHQTLAASRC
ncbi:response regulator transcription factor [Mycolicibacterium sp. XJ870]